MDRLAEGASDLLSSGARNIFQIIGDEAILVVFIFVVALQLAVALFYYVCTILQFSNPSARVFLWNGWLPAARSAAACVRAVSRPTLGLTFDLDVVHGGSDECAPAFRGVGTTGATRVTCRPARRTRRGPVPPGRLMLPESTARGEDASWRFMFSSGSA